MKMVTRRISPVLVVVLAALWLVLNQSMSVAQVLLGTILAVVLTWAASSLRSLHARIRRVDVAAHLVLVVIKDIVLNNLHVARIVLDPGRPRQIRSGFVRIPLELRDPHGLAALAIIVTSTPGTVWAGHSPTDGALTLHVLDLEDESAVIQLIKERYEQPLRRIFE
jgi:multicomponent K+:H+ antiporter subunit E